MTPRSDLTSITITDVGGSVLESRPGSILESVKGSRMVLRNIATEYFVAPADRGTPNDDEETDEG